MANLYQPKDEQHIVQTRMILDKKNGATNYYFNADGSQSFIETAEELQESNAEYYD